jgi:Helix-turn-helix domain
MPTTKIEPLLLTTKELSKALQTSKQTIATWRTQKIIPYLKVGYVIRYDLHRVLAALERREIKEVT